MIGHRFMGTALLLNGDLAESRSHCDKVVAFYDPAEHRSLAARFGQDQRYRPCRGGRLVYGCLAIPMPHFQTPIVR